MIIKKDAEHARLEWVRGWGLVIHFVRESFGRLVLFEKIAWVSRARALLPRKDMAFVGCRASQSESVVS
jgi:hypothetical protein